MSTATIPLPVIKSVGSNGQTSLGKKYAGQQVSLIECTVGNILIKPGKFIPNSEMWLWAMEKIALTKL